MAVNAATLMDQAASHAASTGRFERVNSHEPKSPPGNGLHAAFWVQSITPIALVSGLDATSARVVLMGRIYKLADTEPMDGTDPDLLDATDNLMSLYSGDFQFGGNVRNVDLLGAHGVALSAEAGYLEVGETLYRVMTITLPLILNDVWSQSP